MREVAHALRPRRVQLGRRSGSASVRCRCCESTAAAAIRPARQPRALRRRTSRSTIPARRARASARARGHRGRATWTGLTACISTRCASRTSRRSSARWRPSSRSSATCSRGMKWVNFGGGHHITRPGYEVDDLIRARPGLRATAQGRRSTWSRARRSPTTGVLVAEVLDMIAQRHADRDPRHLRDLPHAGRAGDAVPRRGSSAPASPARKPHTYRLGGQSCLAGDVIGDYSLRAAARRSASAWCSRTWPTTRW